MCLISRYLEAAGIPTLCFSSALDIIEAGRPPRAVFTDYPLGHTVGQPGNRDNQRAILADGLAAFESIDEPGTIVRLPYVWPGSNAWKTDESSAETGDSRAPRGTEPVYQTDADRLAAERA